MVVPHQPTALWAAAKGVSFMTYDILYRGEIIAVPSGADAMVCPHCGSDDSSAWAHDGESDAADYWECVSCGEWGAILNTEHGPFGSDGGPVTYNGVPVTLATCGTRGTREQRYAVPAYCVEGLQTCEREQLPYVHGVSVEYDEHDGFGFPRMSVTATSRDALLSYIREQWGTEDEQWFAEYVIGRIRVRPAGTIRWEYEGDAS